MKVEVDTDSGTISMVSDVSGRITEQFGHDDIRSIGVMGVELMPVRCATGMSAERGLTLDIWIKSR
jgi:hypothetical protein